MGPVEESGEAFEGYRVFGYPIMHMQGRLAHQNIHHPCLYAAERKCQQFGSVPRRRLLCLLYTLTVLLSVLWVVPGPTPGRLGR